MVETAKAQKHNKLTEYDFSHLDRKLKEKPQIGTIALSGVVCYLNNKIPEFIDSLPAEEKKKMVSQVRKESSRRNSNVKGNKMKILEERKREVKKLSENREKGKEELDRKQYGGLWHSKIQMDGCLAAVPVEQHKDVLTTQIRYRKHILDNKPKE